MRPLPVLTFLVSLTLILTACGPQPTAAPTPQLASATPVLPAIITSTPSAGGITMLILPTAKVVESMEGTIQAGTNVRVGPGMLFDVAGNVATEQQVTITGQEPGGNWLYVDNPSGLSGWVNMHFITLSSDQLTPVVKEPSGVLVIKGHIYTPNGNPAYGLGISLLKSNSDVSPQVDSAYSNLSGEWVLYLPSADTGKWTVRADSYGCNSNAVNSACNLIGHFPDPQEVTLPLPAGTWIDFQLLP